MGTILILAHFFIKISVLLLELVYLGEGIHSHFVEGNYSRDII